MKQLIAVIILLGLVGYGVYDQVIKRHQVTTQESITNSTNSHKQSSSSVSGTQGTTSKIKVGISKGDKAPDFTLKTFNNKAIALSDFKGKKIILNFWASWCPPCNAEAPNLEAFYQKHKADNIEIISVNLTTAEKSISNAKSFVNKYHFTFPVLLDPSGAVGNTYQAFSIPTTYIIDSKGMIQQKIVGPMSEDMLSNILANTK